jgi:hypothetical protein
VFPAIMVSRFFVEVALRTAFLDIRLVLLRKVLWGLLLVILDLPVVLRDLRACRLLAGNRRERRIFYWETRPGVNHLAVTVVFEAECVRRMESHRRWFLK